MKNLRQKLLACVALGLIAMPVQAATVEFDFTATPNGFGNEQPSIGYSNGGIDLTVSASTKFFGDPYLDGMNVGQYGNYGLGVVNTYEPNGQTSHAIDGRGGRDRLNLAFSEDVQLLSATFFFYGYNRDFELFGDGNDDNTLDAAGTSHTFSWGDGWYGDISFAALLIAGDLFGIGAGDRMPHYGHYDYSAFKLVSLTVETLGGGGGDIPSVPIPASLPLFGTGLALMGYLGMRRRKKANA